MAVVRTYVLNSANSVTGVAVATYTASDASVNTITISPFDVLSLPTLKSQIAQKIDAIELAIIKAVSIDPAITAAVGTTIAYTSPASTAGV